jgi:hypothetical protein
MVLMAIERGTLQHLIFDNHVLRSHRALAGVLGVILRLPPVKRALASRQVKSRYLEALIRFVQPSFPRGDPSGTGSRRPFVEGVAAPGNEARPPRPA